MKDYIHIGSDKSVLQRLLGQPSRIDANMWTYGTSYFKLDADQKVVAWKNMFGELNDGMRLYMPNDKTFFLGSTMDQVLEAMGSPTTVIHSRQPEWRYEASHIKFRDGIVIEWKNLYNQMDHGMIPPLDGVDFVRLGLTKEAVLKALGSPTVILAINPDIWHYQGSYIKFRDDLVIEWKNLYNQMDHGMKKPEESDDYLQIGMTEKEVLALLGSPTSILASNKDVWKYESSHLKFKNHLLVEWKNMFGQIDLGMKKPLYKDFVRIGMTKDQVLDIFGSPDTISELAPDLWHYKSSHILFKMGHVIEWRNMFHDFDRGMKRGHKECEDVIIGASEEVVLNRLGSPTSIFEREPFTWHYGNAAVYFDDNHHVLSWKNIGDIKKEIERFG
ncbi:outer membrane protein assembly factor BamE [Acidaminobacter sp. JC074]|uniref:outer membrane protein assembly factor BamE domain-containing protein n=1 Tax=Acidaminobacter sp. JC074 TaxID=2530199 RepID=UPI001F0FAD74|nr:outer membrane protein assembly factor BamE [Acidaminobacter sp. JC074]MCH4888694.1 outer membrane protein assembly factor BamE [Acidaminobacter sp. JC074]